MGESEGFGVGIIIVMLIGWVTVAIGAFAAIDAFRLIGIGAAAAALAISATGGALVILAYVAAALRDCAENTRWIARTLDETATAAKSKRT
ncbi:hypothetical protein OEW28_18760 [Defluviimonas sp. WL0002]|uniref:Uncharacterized protein n=2 Tax=Albidovulum marisflavi TaxID=2984159 RepID=A0ABT2ZHQ1_9RHOB|nr:hypothetical protein [Defluviimonas sp. WL0002]